MCALECICESFCVHLWIFVFVFVSLSLCICNYRDWSDAINEKLPFNGTKPAAEPGSRQAAILFWVETDGVSQYAYLCVLSSTCDSWNVISRSPSTCSNAKFASRKAWSKCPDVTWSSHFLEDASEETCAYSGQHISQNAFHRQPETIAEERINYWQLTFYKHYCCWVTECNFRMFCLFDCKK